MQRTRARARASPCSHETSPLSPSCRTSLTPGIKISPWQASQTLALSLLGTAGTQEPPKAKTSNLREEGLLTASLDHQCFPPSSPLSIMETSERHLPPCRDGTAGAVVTQDPSRAGDTPACSSSGGTRATGAGGTTAHPQHHPKHSPGYRERAGLGGRQALCFAVGRKDFAKGPQLSPGRAARAPRQGKALPPFVERRALSPCKPSPPPDVIHPPQQRSHLQNANMYESPGGRAVSRLVWKYLAARSQCPAGVMPSAASAASASIAGCNIWQRSLAGRRHRLSRVLGVRVPQGWSLELPYLQLGQVQLYLCHQRSFSCDS